MWNFTLYPEFSLQPEAVLAAYGTDSDDTFVGSAMSEWVFGRGGDDSIRGGGGGDVLKGEDGNDWLYGGDGGDRLSGGTGADWLEGGDAQDLLDGGAGDDVLLGGADTDYMIGGSGADLFVVEGGDVITDFVRGEDAILVSQLGDRSDFTFAHVNEGGRVDTQITDAGGSLVATVQNVALTHTDFVQFQFSA